ncbi:sensor domain-containing diguanylate cyclase [Halanaerobium kushneri]|jgi:diguanylate cyclase (GGDEF)-like protein/PAS domain S-box-containing protein|uniref:PAS domain S-box-containing protein/diguanylate cyclase (GGDEF) domain-containing protein n=1 Tax=Halanaerobium kushneri TaxID=56779 RepID=A0A1N6P9P7_9FIRM|nr:sensor domain-containing diguanylate cyclase [Halanaerobium kushneri]SIQ01055.1 PAS domain S-box-containing protein/diguanylate cyclase (GGDEF) domain-containing protein [Halanaerobium kushneri]
MLKDLSLETVLNNLTMGIAILDEERDFVYINDLTTRITGYSLSDITNLEQWFEAAFPDPVERGKIYSDFKGKLANGEHYNRVSEIMTKSGEKKFVEFRVNPIEKDYLLINLVDVSRRIEREKEIKYLSYHDELTDLYNRRYFEEEMERLDDSRLYPISIIIGDLDNLKAVNDNYGHLLGDEYLRKAAQILKELLRSEDVVARIGGDEFAILLSETDKKAAAHICERIKAEFNQYNNADSFPIEFKISLGCATARKKTKKLTDIYNQADKNMYKNKGRR